jgi:hypothetical protein
MKTRPEADQLIGGTPPSADFAADVSLTSDTKRSDIRIEWR